MTHKDNLVLERLRFIRSDFAHTKRDMCDIKARLASIESYVATLYNDQIRQAVTIDDILKRLERLEKRTGLIDG
jgi:hypothetical protein